MSLPLPYEMLSQKTSDNPKHTYYKVVYVASCSRSGVTADCYFLTLSLVLLCAGTSGLSLCGVPVERECYS